MKSLFFSFILMFFLGMPSLTSQSIWESIQEEVKGTQPKTIIEIGSKKKVYEFDEDERLTKMVIFDKEENKISERLFEYDGEIYTMIFNDLKSKTKEFTTFDYEGKMIEKISDSETRSSSQKYFYDQNSKIEFEVENRVSKKDSTKRRFITQNIYYQDSLLSKQLLYVNNAPKDSLEQVSLSLKSLDKYVSTTKREVGYEVIGDTLLVSYFSRGELFATEKLVNAKDREYCEVDYARKGNKQITIKSVLQDTTIEESIQYKLEEGHEVPNYKILTRTTRNGYVSQKIELSSNETLNEDELKIEYDEKGNWIEKSIFKNGEFRFKEERTIIYY